MHVGTNPMLGTREHIVARKPIPSALELKKTCEQEVLVGYKPIIMNELKVYETVRDLVENKDS